MAREVHEKEERPVGLARKAWDEAAGEAFVAVAGVGEGITDCLFWLIAHDVHCTVNYSKNIDLSRSDMVDNPVWARENFPYLIHVVFRYSAPGQRKLTDLPGFSCNLIYRSEGIGF